MLDGQPGEPIGTANTMSHALWTCFSHCGVIKCGQTKIWVDSCRLMQAMRNCSIATFAAAGGGKQPYTPVYITGRWKRSPDARDQPRISWPN
jgi:hypothetical protein